jgi:hypothetical protein
MNTNVIPLPQLSEMDKQYLLLEKQRKEILEQRKLIDERKL